MGEQLDDIYRDYIAALNGRRFDDLDRFVHDRLTYNGEEWARDRYKALLADDLQKIPDLHYEIQLLVVRSDHVACRLWFDCTPQQVFLGIDAGGRRVSFAEHSVLPLSGESDRKSVVVNRHRRHSTPVVDAGETMKAGILFKPGSTY